MHVRDTSVGSHPRSCSRSAKAMQRFVDTIDWSIGESLRNTDLETVNNCEARGFELL